MQYYDQPKCSLCGRFYRYEDGDEYTCFGGSADLEPPDPTFMCPRCSQQDEDDQVARGYPDNAWMKSKSQRRAAARLGWKEAGPKTAGWSEWWNPKNPLPDGWAFANEK